jgi:hypothetical protein
MAKTNLNQPVITTITIVIMTTLPRRNQMIRKPRTRRPPMIRNKRLMQSKAMIKSQLLPPVAQARSVSLLSV